MRAWCFRHPGCPMFGPQCQSLDTASPHAGCRVRALHCSAAEKIPQTSVYVSILPDSKGRFKPRVRCDGPEGARTHPGVAHAISGC
jgi:hypothetical protein